LTFEQRKAVTQRLIDEDMYSSKKGDIIIKDKEKARQIYQEMSQNKFAYSPKPQINAPAPSQPTVSPPSGQSAPQGEKKKMSIGDLLRNKMSK
jgi:hypothetical protein